MLKSKKQIDKLVENGEATQVLVYALNNWDEMKEKGKEFMDNYDKCKDKNEIQNG